MYTEEQKNEFVALRARGLSFANISCKLDIPKLTLIRWDKEKNEEISALKECAFEELLDSLKASTSHRIFSLANDLNKIDFELKKYSFEKFHPLELMKLKLKILAELSKFSNAFSVPDNYSENNFALDDVSQLKSFFPKFGFEALNLNK
jgi:hypothetical protein